MKFNNIPNKLVVDTNGNNHWISRSCAVVGIIIGKYAGETYVLVEKRSSIMEEPNKWCAICGYLDFNESGYEAVVRETFEETSFNIEQNEIYLVFDNEKQPFYVQSEPTKDVRQNVSLNYVFIYDFYSLPFNIESFKNDEIDKIKWVNAKNIKDFDFAFNHGERIQMAINKFKDHLNF